MHLTGWRIKSWAYISRRRHIPATFILLPSFSALEQNIDKKQRVLGRGGCLFVFGLFCADVRISYQVTPGHSQVRLLTLHYEQDAHRDGRRPTAALSCAGRHGGGASWTDLWRRHLAISAHNECSSCAVVSGRAVLISLRSLQAQCHTAPTTRQTAYLRAFNNSAAAAYSRRPLASSPPMKPTHNDGLGGWAALRKSRSFPPEICNFPAP